MVLNLTCIDMNIQGARGSKTLLDYQWLDSAVLCDWLGTVFGNAIPPTMVTSCWDQCVTHSAPCWHRYTTSLPWTTVWPNGHLFFYTPVRPPLTVSLTGHNCLLRYLPPGDSTVMSLQRCYCYTCRVHCVVVIKSPDDNYATIFSCQNYHQKVAVRVHCHIAGWLYCDITGCNAMLLQSCIVMLLQHRN